MPELDVADLNLLRPEGAVRTSNGSAGVRGDWHVHIVLHDDADNLWCTGHAGVIGVDQVCGIHPRNVVTPMGHLSLHARFCLSHAHALARCCGTASWLNAGCQCKLTASGTWSRDTDAHKGAHLIPNAHRERRRLMEQEPGVIFKDTSANCAQTKFQDLHCITGLQDSRKLLPVLEGGDFAVGLSGLEPQACPQYEYLLLLELGPVPPQCLSAAAGMWHH